MKKLLTILTISLMWACKTTAVEPTSADDIVGLYNVIIDPIRCSLPSTNQVLISKDGDNYRVSYTQMGTQKNASFGNIKAEMVGTSLKLTLNGQDFGKYIKDTYIDIDGKKEGMVLYLRFDTFEFMGNK